MLCGWMMILLMILLVVDFAGRGVPSTVRMFGEILGSTGLVALSEASWLQPMSVLADLSVFFMIIAVYLGLALCEERGQHVGIEIADTVLKGKTRQAVKVLSYLLQAVIVCVMVYALYKNTMRSFTRNEAVSGLVALNLWPVKACALFGLVLYCIQVFVELGIRVRVFLNPKMTD